MVSGSGNTWLNNAIVHPSQCIHHHCQWELSTYPHVSPRFGNIPRNVGSNWVRGTWPFSPAPYAFSFRLKVLMYEKLVVVIESTLKVLGAVHVVLGSTCIYGIPVLSAAYTKIRHLGVPHVSRRWSANHFMYVWYKSFDRNAEPVINSYILRCVLHSDKSKNWKIN